MNKFQKWTNIVFLALGSSLFLNGCASAQKNRLEQDFKPDRKRQLNLKKIEDTLNNGANPNVVFADGTTPLIGAVVYNQPGLLKKLLQKGANPNLPAKRGSTALHAAAGLNRMECLELLLSAGANVNLPGAFGRTPLMEAARIGNLRIMEKLMSAKADIQATDEQGRTVLMHSAGAPANSLEGSRMLILQGADFMKMDNNAKFAVMHAVERKNTKTAMYLLELLPPLRKNPGLGLLVMHSAVRSNELKIMDHLLDSGVPLNRRLSTVLKGTRILQIHGAYRILVRNGLLNKGRVPLHWAAIENNLDAVKLLIRRGADPFQPDELGFRPDELALSREVIHFIRNEQKKIQRKISENGEKIK